MNQLAFAQMHRQNHTGTALNVCELPEYSKKGKPVTPKTTLANRLRTMVASFEKTSSSQRNRRKFRLFLSMLIARKDFCRPSVRRQSVRNFSNITKVSSAICGPL